jgi:hypothetical protein
MFFFMSLNCYQSRAYCLSPTWYNSTESESGMVFRVETRRTWRETYPVPLCPPELSHGLIRARTWVSAARVRKLTAWAMARPFRYDVALPVAWTCLWGEGWDVSRNSWGKTSLYVVCTVLVVLLMQSSSYEAVEMRTACRGSTSDTAHFSASSRFIYSQTGTSVLQFKIRSRLHSILQATQTVDILLLRCHTVLIV